MLPAICAADAPHKLGGFVLGGKIEDFRNKIKPGTELPVRYAESLKEVEVRDIPGFKTGLVYYGTCKQPSLILRIEFKYQDSSKTFFETLLQRFKKRLGEPDEWRGDPFHVVIGWKWQFVDRNNNNISLILKHNTRDEEQKEGNYIKMTMWNLMNREVRCYKESQQRLDKTPTAGRTPERSENIQWDLLVPR
jgi:hypothetical protein